MIPELNFIFCSDKDIAHVRELDGKFVRLILYEVESTAIKTGDSACVISPANDRKMGTVFCLGCGKRHKWKNGRVDCPKEVVD